LPGVVTNKERELRRKRRRELLKRKMLRKKVKEEKLLHQLNPLQLSQLLTTRQRMTTKIHL